VIPVIALIGRPNVGKSTLFNYLTQSRDALVADYPGLTRDRKYGLVRLTREPMIVVDTGGLADDPNAVESLMAKQVAAALEEAHVVVFLVDGRHGMTAADEMIAQRLRRLNKQVFLVLNKTEGLDRNLISSEFFSLGLGDPLAISAAHGQGVKSLLQIMRESIPEEVLADPAERPIDQGVRIAVVGRPNVGKSTLVNRLLGEERQLTFDSPGTTRDSVSIPFEKNGKQYTLIDTAGVRRRSRIDEVIEKFSVIKTMQAIEQSNVVIMLLDARQEVADQDMTLLGHIIESGRALVIAINKWDGLDPYQREQIKSQIDRQLGFVDFARMYTISALHGSGVGLLLDEVDKVYASAMRDLPTPELTRALESAVEQHQPPLVKGRRIKLRYAHQGGSNPPIIVIHGNQTDSVPGAYHKYLVNYFRKTFKLSGTPLRIEFKGGTNPYEGKRNSLTERQIKKRKRMIKHYKN
jgi:GTP-binding protein